MDDRAALQVSADELRRRLVAIGPDDLDRPSVCGDWSVRELANHVLGGAQRYLLLLADADADSLAATRTHDYVGGEPVVAHDELVPLLETAFAAPGALEKTVHHPLFERSGLELMRMRIAEQALHAVDLACSLGLDETLDAGLVDYMLVNVAPAFDAGRELGAFGPEREVAADASPQERLLAAAGR
jgi:uncharacterized protein (TIGR03086 family)